MTAPSRRAQATAYLNECLVDVSMRVLSDRTCTVKGIRIAPDLSSITVTLELVDACGESTWWELEVDADEPEIDAIAEASDRGASMGQVLLANVMEWQESADPSPAHHARRIDRRTDT